ncbi:MAG: hypothetical protein WC291_00900 [Thermodesulfovibrionales bacterium]|jgi:hypothetical protein
MVSKSRKELEEEADIQIEAATEGAVARVQAERAQEDWEKSKTLKCINVAVKSGRAQAFHAMSLLSEYLEWKALAGVVEKKEYLDIPGIETVDQYLQYLGLSSRTGYNQLKIARTLSPDEVQLFAELGFSRKDLLGYASLPDEQRLQIREGKVINLEQAQKEDIRQLIEELVIENKQVKEEKDGEVKARDRRLKDKEDHIHKLTHEVEKLEKKVANRVDYEGLTEQEAEDQQLLSQIMTDMTSAFTTARKQIQPATAPEKSQRALYFLYIYLSKLLSDGLTELYEYYKDAQTVPWEYDPNMGLGGLRAEDIPMTDLPWPPGVADKIKNWQKEHGK